STPQAPLAPWMLIAPTGSSTPILSKKKQLRTTSTPATRPMMNAPIGLTNAHGAVIATSPASRALHIMPGSGFLVGPNNHMNIVPDSVALMPASMVLVAMMPMRPSIADNELPGLNPNHPNARMNDPSMTIGMSCAAIGLTTLPFLYLPRRGPIRK